MSNPRPAPAGGGQPAVEVLEVHPPTPGSSIQAVAGRLATFVEELLIQIHKRDQTIRGHERENEKLRRELRGYVEGSLDRTNLAEIGERINISASASASSSPPIGEPQQQHVEGSEGEEETTDEICDNENAFSVASSQSDTESRKIRGRLSSTSDDSAPDAANIELGDDDTNSGNGEPDNDETNSGNGEPNNDETNSGNGEPDNDETNSGNGEPDNDETNSGNGEPDNDETNSGNGEPDNDETNSGNGEPDNDETNSGNGESDNDDTVNVGNSKCDDDYSTDPGNSEIDDDDDDDTTDVGNSEVDDDDDDTADEGTNESDDELGGSSENYECEDTTGNSDTTSDSNDTEPPEERPVTRRRTRSSYYFDDDYDCGKEDAPNRAKRMRVSKAAAKSKIHDQMIGEIEQGGERERTPRRSTRQLEHASM